jgi:hypothetical protein
MKQQEASDPLTQALLNDAGLGQPGA